MIIGYELRVHVRDVKFGESGDDIDIGSDYDDVVYGKQEHNEVYCYAA